MPRHLHDSFGGLKIWQYPNQLAPYLIELSRYRIGSYAEIGLFHGGTFAVTVEYLSRFHPLRSALGVDAAIRDEVRAYAAINPIVELVEAHSDSPRVRQAFERTRPDLVFIDADHSEPACRGDWLLARDVARFVGFHDIAEATCPGVAKVWAETDGRKSEFTDQYEGVSRSTYGIGLVEL